jgi:single-strand DNA-binding protein
MSRQFNKVTFVGHLGNAPEMRYTPSVKPVTSFNVASNDQYTNEKGETVKVTTWFRCTSWGKSAEVHNQYLHKGSKVLVEGRLSPDGNTGGPKTFTRKDGSVGASYDVTASTVRFLTPRGEGEGGAPGEEVAPAAGGEEDIPF